MTPSPGNQNKPFFPKKEYKDLLSWIHKSLRKKEVDELKFLLEIPGRYFCNIYYTHIYTREENMGIDVIWKETVKFSAGMSQTTKVNY